MCVRRKVKRERERERERSVQKAVPNHQKEKKKERIFVIFGESVFLHFKQRRVKIFSRHRNTTHKNFISSNLVYKK